MLSRSARGSVATSKYEWTCASGQSEPLVELLRKDMFLCYGEKAQDSPLLRHKWCLYCQRQLLERIMNYTKINIILNNIACTSFHNLTWPSLLSFPRPCPACSWYPSRKSCRGWRQIMWRLERGTLSLSSSGVGRARTSKRPTTSWWQRCRDRLSCWGRREGETMTWSRRWTPWRNSLLPGELMRVHVHQCTCIHVHVYACSLTAVAPWHIH